jgi:hypothetical protein
LFVLFGDDDDDYYYYGFVYVASEEALVGSADNKNGVTSVDEEWCLLGCYAVWLL